MDLRIAVGVWDFWSRTRLRRSGTRESGRGLASARRGLAKAVVDVGGRVADMRTAVGDMGTAVADMPSSVVDRRWAVADRLRAVADMLRDVGDCGLQLADALFGGAIVTRVTRFFPRAAASTCFVPAPGTSRGTRWSFSCAWAKTCIA